MPCTVLGVRMLWEGAFQTKKFLSVEFICSWTINRVKQVYSVDVRGRSSSEEENKTERV